MELNPEEKLVENDGIDRISDLPDSILEKILSNLPTKNAVATSILSTRWKNLSPFAVLPIRLILNDYLLLHPKENEPDSPSTSFTDFVDKLLNVTLSDVPSVKAMCLICHRSYGDAKILSWVSAALRLHLQCLFMWLCLSESYALFRGLNGCTTLVRLMLVLESELCVPDNFSLPNLKSLELWKFTLNDEEADFLSELIEGCPLLEDLCLVECTLGCSEYLTINAPRLKNLKIEGCFTESRNTLCLDAPNLEVLHLNDHVTLDYYVTYFESLLAAHINVGPSQKLLDEEGNDCDCYEDDGSWMFDNSLARLVTACYNTISLYLSACSIGALFRSSQQLPEFENLTLLSLGCFGDNGWAMLARFATECT